MHDVILRYSHGDDVIWNQLYEQISESFQKRFKGQGNVLDRGATKKRATDHKTPGLPMRTVQDLSIIAPASKERLGYPTQKPVALLECIINASPNPGDVVLDPFCGCGTATHAAEKLKRQWIGIDISPFATGLIRNRILDNFQTIVTTADIAMYGMPETVDDAQALAARDKFEFEKWACGLIGAEGMFAHQPGDRGTDGGVEDLLRGKPLDLPQYGSRRPSLLTI